MKTTRVVAAVAAVAFAFIAGAEEQSTKAKVYVQIVGFPAGTRVALDARAAYTVIDPFSNPSHRGQVSITENMVRRRIDALNGVVSTGAVTTVAPTLSTVLEFNFPERLQGPPQGTAMLARVEIPISFSYSDPVSGAMSTPRRLGAIPVSIEHDADELSRCFRIEAKEGGGYRFDIIKDARLCGAP
jgi:hypothetical protein